jgi:hypothetical protein
MESPQLALLLSRTATQHYAGSARPDAPVVEDRRSRRRRRASAAGTAEGTVRTSAPRVRLARTRTTLASALRRAADAVAPACEPHGLAR